MLYKTASVADFIMSDEHLQLLSSVNKLVFDEHSKVRPLNLLLEFLLYGSHFTLHTIVWEKFTIGYFRVKLFVVKYFCMTKFF